MKPSLAGITELRIPLDCEAMWRVRCIRLKEGEPRLPRDPVYQPAVNFVRRYETQYQRKGYPFALIALIHAAGQRMLQPLEPAPSDEQAVFAAGGLCLAIDDQHPDLAFRAMFGDFASGFTHQLGVGMACLALSEAYNVPWDALTPIIAGSKQKTLDYKAELPRYAGQLLMEAKGTSADSGEARRDIKKKKKAASPRDPATAMIGVITRMARRPKDLAELEIIDPDLDDESGTANEEQRQAAARYWHYARAAMFAGQRSAASEMASRGRAVLRGQSRPDARLAIPPQASILRRMRHELVGIRWRLDNNADDRALWFYQAIDVERLRSIIEVGPPFETRAYNDDWRPVAIAGTDSFAESLLPDGSYFAIGVGEPIGLNDIAAGSSDLAQVDFVG